MSTTNSDDHSSDSSDMEQEALEVTIAIRILDEYEHVHRRPCYTRKLSGYEFIKDILNGHPDRMFNMFRMDRRVFLQLCSDLEHLNLLESDRHIGTQEALAMCLYILSHGAVMRVVAEIFQHANDTVYRQFHHVLKALCGLEPHIIRPPNQGQTSPVITNNPKFFPYFEKCIGAIDGTHISAWTPTCKQTSYRDRKIQVTQNIMCACSFDMIFTFVYTGLEGTANDSRVFIDAITRQENKFSFPEEGYYYVVDFGYINMPGFLTPYRGQRYHLRDYRGTGRAPRGYKELFNYRHSSLRNVIERCFGVLKARFSILKNMHNYRLCKQRLIPIACCVLHNFIRKEAERDRLFEEFSIEDMVIDEIEDVSIPIVDLSHASVEQMNLARDRILSAMWLDYTCNN